VPMPEVNSSPRKLTAPPGLFETVSKKCADFTRQRLRPMKVGSGKCADQPTERDDVGRVPVPARADELGPLL
ncbi:hypothetical protein, partial [Burkholderia vietnamiensis]|uniref:hypothetical protein n=1 Tax=Burkholderia vietnamiensis TaxID=60552 RepID=UPI001E2F2CD6